MLSLSAERAKLILVGILVLVLTTVVSSASVQHHPFSEIFPPDKNLGFGGNDIENVSRVELSDIVPDGADIIVRDAGDNPTLRWDESAGEWRLNGVNLNASGNSVTDLDSLDGENGAININSVLAMNSNSVNGLNNLGFNGGTTYIIQNSDGDNIFVQADSSSGNRNNYIRIDPDNQITSFPTGNVRVVNGNLDLNSNSITNFFAAACPSGEVIADIGDDGTFQCVSMSDEVSSDYVARVGDSMTGNLDMTGNNILNVGDIQGSGIVSANELASNAVTASGGELDSSVAGTFLSETSGSLNVQSGSMTWSDLGIAQSDIGVSDLGAADANLNMNGNSITNYFGSACPSGQTVVDVNDDGSFQCMDVSGEVASDYVSRSGDSMTGALEMNGNNVNGINTVNSGGATLNTGGDVVSSGAVRSSSSLETDSGTVTTSGTGMCIGDQC